MAAYKKGVTNMLLKKQIIVAKRKGLVTGRDQATPCALTW